MDFKQGDLVKYLGASDAQISWGKNDDPRSLLENEKLYVVDEMEIHNTYTQISLKGIKGKFNSVSFSCEL